MFLELRSLVGAQTHGSRELGGDSVTEAAGPPHTRFLPVPHPHPTHSWTKRLSPHCGGVGPWGGSFLLSRL